MKSVKLCRSIPPVEREKLYGLLHCGLNYVNIVFVSICVIYIPVAGLFAGTEDDPFCCN